MDDLLKPYLDALKQLCEGRADYLDAGDITFQLLCPGLIFIHLGDRDYLYEGISGLYNLREVL